jgi:hypothetical protein
MLCHRYVVSLAAAIILSNACAQGGPNPEEAITLFADTGPGVHGEYRLGDEVVEFSARRIVTDVEVDGETRVETYRDAEQSDSVFQMEVTYFDVTRKIRVSRLGERMDQEVGGESVASPADWDRALAVIGQASAALHSYEGAIPTVERDALIELAVALPGNPSPASAYDMHYARWECEGWTGSPTFIPPYTVVQEGHLWCDVPDPETTSLIVNFRLCTRAKKTPSWRYRYRTIGCQYLSGNDLLNAAYDALPWDPGKKFQLDFDSKDILCRAVGRHRFQNEITRKVTAEGTPYSWWVPVESGIEDPSIEESGAPSFGVCGD